MPVLFNWCREQIAQHKENGKKYPDSKEEMTEWSNPIFRLSV
jgi:hypothetical protein